MEKKLDTSKNKRKKKNKRWSKLRHGFFRLILIVPVAIITRCRYHVRVKRFKPERGQPYLILYNHQTAFDQFFVAMAFPRTVYYLASEDIFSNGFVSKLIKFLVEPIPIKKQTTDVRAVMNCIKVAREGGTIALAPEGNRTYSGKTEYMNPAIIALAKKLGLPIALMRIEGGYGVHPRWSDVVRRGKMTAGITRVISPEEYAPMSSDELGEVISRELYVNEAVADKPFRHTRRAEYLERAMYVCPECGISRFYSTGSTIECTKCKLKATYTEKKELLWSKESINLPFVNDWYEYQCGFIRSLDTLALTSEPIRRDTAAMSEVIVYRKKEMISDSAELSLFGDRLEIRFGGEKRVMPFAELSALTVLGKNKLNVYFDDKIYQFKGDKHFSALIYVNVFYRSRGILKGESNGEFLGL